MSGAPKPTFLMPVYDAQELRRRMAVCFTIGELYRLAEKLGVPATPAWSNSPQDASRDIVRHFERSGALPFLVEALQEAKPLVEWPQPTMPAAPPPIAASPSAPAAGAAAPGSTSFAAPVSAAFEEAGDADGAPGDRPTPIATISAAAVFASSRGHSSPPAAMPPSPAGFAPATMPRPGEAPPASASGPGAPVPAAARTDVDGDLAAFMAAGSGAAAKPLPGTAPSSPGPTPAWPGTVRAGGPPPAKAAPDYRIIAAAGAALLVGAVAIAFFVGRASSAATSDAGSTSDTSAAPPPPGDHAALSQHVVGALGASLERVARDCQIDLGTLQGHSLFEVAYRRCGPLPVQAAAQQRPAYDPGVSGDPIDAPDPPRKGRTTGGNKLQKVDATPAGPGGGSGSTCLSRCQQSHGACTSRCGAEPKQGSQYDAYQACLGGCLKAMSQCKMGCQ